MKHLYFMRHGLCVMNVQGLRVSRIESPLTDEGRRQAQLAGHHAKKYGIDTIVASPLSRTLETAEIMAEELGIPKQGIRVSELLIERDFGNIDGKPYDRNIDLENIPDVEPFGQLRSRAKLALEWIESLGGDNVLVVSHGGLGRAMRSLLKPEIDRSVQLANAEIEQWL